MAEAISDIEKLADDKMNQLRMSGGICGMKSSVRTVKNVPMKLERKLLVSKVPVSDRMSFGSKSILVKDSKLQTLPTSFKLKPPASTTDPLYEKYNKINDCGRRTKIPIKKPIVSDIESPSKVLQAIPYIPTQDLNNTVIHKYSSKPPKAARALPTLNKRGFSFGGRSSLLHPSSDGNKKADAIKGMPAKHPYPVRPKWVCSTPRGGCRGGTKPKASPLNPKISKCESNANKDLKKGLKGGRPETMCGSPKVLKRVSSFRRGELFSTEATGVLRKSDTLPQNLRKLDSIKNCDTLLMGSHDSNAMNVDLTKATDNMSQLLRLSCEAIVEQLRAEHAVQGNESLLQDQSATELLVGSEDDRWPLTKASPDKMSLQRMSILEASILESEINLRGQLTESFLVNNDDTRYHSMLDDTKYMTFIDESS